jgi:hypothetical protein
MAGPSKVCRHSAAHDTQSDESNFHFGLRFVIMPRAHSKLLWVLNYWLPKFAAGLQNPNLETRARLHTAMLALVHDAAPGADVPQFIRDWKTSSDAQ